MRNHKRRLERLERGRKNGGFHVIIVHPGESVEELQQKYLAEHPKAANRKGWIIIRISASSPSSAPPPRPKAAEPAKVSATGPIQITY